jgi:hypothetical protein
MVISTIGSFNMYFPAQVTVNYNPKEISTFTQFPSSLLGLLVPFPACIASSGRECIVFWLDL